ncbi:autotransporter domain-containing protein, partial [Bradyrhizobium sp. KB893862 SZCCT0404]|uniref:autotransporter outer membrane beta-barrel domain-containing protein n=1 Tax=Bradyrhizobium sp. KB893862 SZCCT0404 TaxID=2807672 RepID=UPI001BAC1862
MRGKRNNQFRAASGLRAALLTSSALALAWTPQATPARAQDATWLANPANADITNGGNWSTGTAPTGTATFGTSTITAVDVTASAGTYGGWTINAGNYTFTVASTQTFTGAGIVVNGGSATITTVDGGLDFRNSSSAGSATINLSDGSFKDSNFYNTSTAANATINVSSNDSLNFRDSSTAGSATIVNNGGLLTWNTATLGNATITSNGGFYLENSSSAGNAKITNNDWMYFYDSTTAGTATIVNNYRLNFWTNSSAGSARITNVAAGTLEIVNSSTLANATVINSGHMSFWGGNFGDVPTAGSAAITNNAGGTIEFLNSGTAGNATIVNDGEITFKATSTAGSATIASSNSVVFKDHSTAGDAQLIATAPGAVFDFSGSSGSNADDRLTAGSFAGSGTFQLGNKELTVGSNNLSTEVTGVLADGGSGGGTGASLVKVGTGMLTLSGVNTYTGATTVDSGTLMVNGSILSSSGVTVNAGATFGGTGIVGNTTIASGGTLAPGNPTGTLTVSGNLAFSAGSFYNVQISASANGRTHVTGTATLTGATLQVVASLNSFRSQYTILNATGGLVGTFAGATFASSARNPHLTYDLNSVYLVLDPGRIALPAGMGGNQTGVAGAINAVAANGGTPPAGFDALLNLNGAQLNHALGQISGQPGAAGTQAAFDATQQFLNMLDPFGGSDGERGTSADGGSLGYAASGSRDARVRRAYAAVTPRGTSGDAIDRRWGVWAAGYGGASTVNGNVTAGSNTTTSRIYGTAVGADYRVSPNTLVGFALGGGGFNFSVADALGSGRADIFQAGLYARHNFGPAYLSAALAYGWQDVTTDRTVTVAGTDKLTANFKASTFAGRLETGWRFVPVPASSFGVTPYAAVQAVTIHLPGYGETALVGSNQFALAYSSQDTTNVRTELGTRTDQRFLVSDGLLTLRGRLAWAHDTNTNRFVNAAFQTLPGAAFTVNGARPAADSALVGGRAEMAWRNGFSLAGTVEGEFSRSTQTYTGKG